MNLNWFKNIFKKPAKRGFDAAQINRLTRDWAVDITSSDRELQPVLSILRERSRDLARNNDYAKKFLKMSETNVVGPSGIILQNKAKKENGNELDSVANSIIEDEWVEWGKKGNCTVDGYLSFQSLQSLIIKTVMRDGEIIIRKIKGWENRWNFALQIVEADYLDENLNDQEKNLKMGVQLDSWGRPQLYHLFKKHPGDQFQNRMQKEYSILKADEIVHPYFMERPQQTRGIPAFHTSIIRLRNLGKYEEAELVASRIGAAKMGFFKKPEGNITEIISDSKDAEGNMLKKVEPGILDNLPPGWDFVGWDPKHPTEQFDKFIKATLRGISAGLNVSYNSLACDLEGVNYSSLRSGALEERDNWRVIQSWMIDWVLNPIFSDWLYWSIVSQAVKLPFRSFDRFNKPTWRPRGWAWVDPEKDAEANRKEVLAGFRTRSQIVGEMGYELEDIFQELQKEKELEQKYGLELKLEKPATPLGA